MKSVLPLLGLLTMAAFAVLGAGVIQRRLRARAAGLALISIGLFGLLLSLSLPRKALFLDNASILFAVALMPYLAGMWILWARLTRRGLGAAQPRPARTEENTRREPRFASGNVDNFAAEPNEPAVQATRGFSTAAVAGVAGIAGGLGLASLATASTQHDHDWMNHNDDIGKPLVNIDGTPMIAGTDFDIHGNAFGVTSDDSMGWSGMGSGMDSDPFSSSHGGFGNDPF